MQDIYNDVFIQGEVHSVLGVILIDIKNKE